MKWVWMAGVSFGIAAFMVQTPGDLSVRLNGQTVASADRADFVLPGLPLADPGKVDAWLDEVGRRVYREPKNAAIGGDGRIVPEQPGFRLDRRGMADRLLAFFYGSGAAAEEAPLRPVHAKVDAELLSEIREKPIGLYVTYFNARNRNRAHNIAMSAKAIDSRVVFPGEKFSFNRTVGIRSVERGYLRAPIIVRGELAEGIGGGICQVSSTLYNAVDRAGLKILERYSHSRHVPYVRPGRDATVSWNGPDFVFQNPYGQPVLIRTFAGPGRIMVAVYSSDAIEHKPRMVPGVSRSLPKEIPLEEQVNR